MNRHHVFVVLGLGFIAFGIAAVLGLGSCSRSHWSLGDWSSPTVDGVSLPHRTTLTLSSKDKPARFEMNVSAGELVVTGDPTVAGIEATVEVNEKTAGDASVVATADGLEFKSASGSPVFVASAKVRVPPGTPVVASADTGSVTVEGIDGATEVSAKSDAGEVKLRNLKNLKKLVAGTDVGSVHAKSVQALEAKFSADVGEVRVEDGTFDHVSAHSDVGSVKLKRCTYKTKDADTDVGDVSDTK